MNSDNNTVTAWHSGDPTNDGQIRVSARLLFPYITNSPIPFKEWEESLRRVSNDLGYIVRGYRVFDESREELVLNLKLAMHFIIGSSIYPNGVIAWVLLEEALSEAEIGDVDSINRLLKKHWNVGIIPRHVQAKALHTFLCCGISFDEWFLAQKKSQRLAYGRDYVRIDNSNVTHPNSYRRDIGKGEIYLGHDAAQRLITATPTPRGKLVSAYLRNPILRGSGV